MGLFHHCCIPGLLQRQLPRGEQTCILECLAGQEWELPRGEWASLSVSTLKSRLARHRKGGFEPLDPRCREDHHPP
ncbi:MAG: hypothetical protein AB1503_08910 [Bacillota bacterium]|nr:hypothetical protein [Bacillota bacterium]